MNTALVEFMFSQDWGPTPPPPSTSPSWVGAALTNRIRWEGYQMAAALLFAILLTRVTYASS